MAGIAPLTIGKRIHDSASEGKNIVKDMLDDLSQLSPSVQHELARRFRDMVHSPAPGKSSTETCKGNGQNLYSEIIVGPRWREIQGEREWEGLLDPIDDVLRAEILRYGEFAQVTYDSFDSDQQSKFCGSCKYLPNDLFEEVKLFNTGYEVTDYIYATAQLDFPHVFNKSAEPEPWSKNSNWMGYVAVTTSPAEIARLGRRDILVAWRGTATTFEWIKDMQFYAAPTLFKDGVSVYVPKGFLNVYRSRNAHSRYNQESAQQQVQGAVNALVQKYKQEETELSITITGHSLGSALSILCAYDLGVSDLNVVYDHGPKVPNSSRTTNDVMGFQGGSQRRRIPITVYSFAGPRVGSRELQSSLKELRIAVLSVVNKHDLVTKVPHVSLCDGIMQKLRARSDFLVRYKQVGVKFKLDHEKSPFLEAKNFLSLLQNQMNFHNLEAYLHLVDGFHSSSSPFREMLLRNYILVNKRCTFLKKKYNVPPCWWQSHNKGVQMTADGSWHAPERSQELYPKSPEGSCSRYRPKTFVGRWAMKKLRPEDDK